MLKQSYNSYRITTWVVCMCLSFSVLAQDKVDVYQKKEGNNAGIALDWELNYTEAYLTKLKNEPVSVGKPLGYYYRVAMRFPLNAAGAKYRLYAKTGLGPEFKSFSLNKVISVADEKLVFTDFSSTNNLKYSVFQQCFVNVPVLLSIEKQYGRKNKVVTLEGGIVAGIQVYNRWRALEVNDGVNVEQTREDLPQTNPLQWGGTITLSNTRQFGPVAIGLQINGTRYFTEVFHTNNAHTNSYTLSLGLVITANRLHK